MKTPVSSCARHCAGCLVKTSLCAARMLLAQRLLTLCYMYIFMSGTCDSYFPLRCPILSYPLCRSLSREPPPSVSARCRNFSSPDMSRPAAVCRGESLYSLFVSLARTHITHVAYPHVLSFHCVAQRHPYESYESLTEVVHHAVSLYVEVFLLPYPAYSCSLVHS